jgi:serine/threonine protein kinase
MADFGFAKRLASTTSSFCGTPDYIAIEILANKPYSYQVDWWSFGVLIFELISGKTPFRAANSDGIYENIGKMNIQYLSVISGPVKDIVSRLLDANPKTRLGANGSEEIKAMPFFRDINWKKMENRQVSPPVIPLFASPETLELEKITKGGITNYRDMLEDKSIRLSDYKGVFKEF